MTTSPADGLREMIREAMGGSPVPWRRLLRPGDWLLLAGATVLVGTSFPIFWRGGAPDRAASHGADHAAIASSAARDRIDQVPGRVRRPSASTMRAAV